MQYVEVTIGVENNENFREELIARLLMIGFDSFLENPQGLVAYIEPARLNLPELEDIIKNSRGKAVIENIANLPEQNWNELWESNYEPVIVEEQCLIRAPFHQKPDSIPFDIVIQPKMSFGTAHHATTQLMIRFLLHADLRHKQVLDMGTGTGVLAILAAMKGAEKVVAIDTDEWAFENATENCQRNGVNETQVILGDVSAIPDTVFDVFLANINRNVLLRDLINYDTHLVIHGQAFLSGFYTEDIESIVNEAHKCKWKMISKRILDGWAAIGFVKTGQRNEL